MNVSLTPELAKVVDGKVESRLCNTASEIVREGLRCSRSMTKFAKVRQQVEAAGSTARREGPLMAGVFC